MYSVDARQLLCLAYTGLAYLTNLGAAKAVSLPTGCNQTFYPSEDRMTLKFEFRRFSRYRRFPPVNCRFNFNATDDQYVDVFVKSLIGGYYNDEEHGCIDGYLRIWDGSTCSHASAWLPPTTMCGHFRKNKLLVRRISKSPFAMVEFQTNQYGAYLFEVTFKKKNKAPEKLPYGSLQRKNGYINHTRCDWLVPVNKCAGFCKLTSPGWPGIYPPTTRCRYLLTNFNDGRVELKLGGDQYGGKFDLKYSKNCTEDYVELYDGAMTASPLIGRFCGHEGPHVISTGPSLLMVFRSGHGSPDWDYSGFNAQAGNRWPVSNDGGRKLTDTECDWIFHGADVQSGSTNTPDYKLPRNTICNYHFVSNGTFHIGLDIVIYNIKAGCIESLSIYQEGHLVDSICSNNLSGDSLSSFSFRLGTTNATLVYTNQDGQLSNADPMWLDFEFSTDKQTDSYLIYSLEPPREVAVVQEINQNRASPTQTALSILILNVFISFNFKK